MTGSRVQVAAAAEVATVQPLGSSGQRFLRVGACPPPRTPKVNLIPEGSYLPRGMNAGAFHWKVGG